MPTSLEGTSDLFVACTLKWNRGVHNFMVYSMGNLPAGAYDPNRLVNLGLGHASPGAGGGYTYFNKDNELSLVAGRPTNGKTPTRTISGLSRAEWTLT
ncbi:transporter [Pseudomonas sp. NY15435]|uniref:transporter n=1 Tax=Pseudomonas TaxID=286 RepID=UPI001F552FCE|nr:MULTISPECIES: transporter [Pseudomonas]